jgi:hypothetical protein
VQQLLMCLLHQRMQQQLLLLLMCLLHQRMQQQLLMCLL